jgi:hypothetical protein
MIGYKLFRERKDGSLGPLFINRKLKIQIGVSYPMEEHRTRGFAFRPGWHICRTPRAPHLSMKNRAWYKVEFELLDIIDRPDSQGGTWYLGKTMKVISKHISK